MWRFGRKLHIWLVAVVFYSVKSSPESCSITTPPSAATDFVALSTLYHSTGGANWSKNAHWLDGCPCGKYSWRNWESVNCNESRVVAIHLRNNKMKGSLPTEVGLLDSLTRAVFSRNSALSGTLPSQVGHLAKLRGLNFANVEPNSASRNKFADYFECVAAESADVLACDNSTNLLPSTGVSGVLPSELGRLLSIEELEMGNCHYTSIPTQMGKLTTLRSIGLEHNKIRGTVPTELGFATSLVRASFFQNGGLGGPIPTEVGQLKELRGDLNFASCAFTASLPTQLGRLSNMEVGLGMRSNNMTGAVPTQIGNLIRTKIGLAFDYNRLSSSLPTQLGNMAAVEIGFTLMHNKISGPIPTQLGRLTVLGSTVKHLSDENYVGGLALNLNSLSSSIPTELGMLTSMASGYSFCQNSLSGSMPTQLGSMSRIRSGIGAMSNYLTGPLPTELGGLTDVEFEFNFNTNSISSSIPTELGRLANFKLRFFMHSNQLRSTIPTELAQISHGRKLYINDNSLSGSLPTQLGSMSYLEQLFLQTNQLDSSIPTEIGLLTPHSHTCFRYQLEKPHRVSEPCGLQYLVLEKNRLGGTLPLEMCKLKSLVVFSAYKNSMSGSVPNCTFPYMTYFNLGRNDFHGRLPSIEGWDSLNNLLLHKNRFHGSLASLAIDGPFDDDDSRTIYLGGNLTALTLHNNRLDRPFPKNLFLPPNLTKFTVSYNKIPGTVPKALLAQLKASSEESNSGNSGKSRTILLSNNRLSCKLPKLDSTDGDNAALNLDSSSLVLLGNLFSQTIPQWVRKSERDNTFLSTAVQIHGVTVVPKWFSLLSQFTVAFIITGAALLMFRRSGAGAIADNLCVFMRRCTVLLASFVAGSLVCLVPIFYLGANYFECGDPLMKYSTIAYMADSKVLESLAAAFLAVYTFALALMLEKFVPAHSLFDGGATTASGSKDVTMSFAQDFDDLKTPLMESLGRDDQNEERNEEQNENNGEDERKAAEEKAAEEEGHDETPETQDMDCFIYEFGLPHLENVQARPPDTAELPASEQKDAGGDADFPMGADNDLRPGLSSFSLKNDIRRASFVAKLKCLLYVMASILFLFLLGGVPTVLWIMTYSIPTDNTLNMNSQTNFFNKFLALVYPNRGLAVILNKFLAFYLALFSSFALPSLTAFTVRRVLSVLVGHTSVLTLHKLQTTVSIISRTVLVIVIPCAAVIYFNDGCFHKWRHFWNYCQPGEVTEDDDGGGIISVQYDEYEGVQSGTLKEQQGGIQLNFAKHLKHAICHSGFDYGNACARDVLSVLGPLMIEKMIYVVLFSSLHPLMPWALGSMARVRRWLGWEEISRSRDAPLNPMRLFMNLETALVFGGMVPLLLPLMALQLWVDTCAFEWQQSRVPSRKTLPVPWRGMQCHSVLVLVLHSMLLIFVFWESNLKGKYELTVVVTTILLWFLVAASWRVSMFDIVRFRF